MNRSSSTFEHTFLKRLYVNIKCEEVPGQINALNPNCIAALSDPAWQDDLNISPLSTSLTREAAYGLQESALFCPAFGSNRPSIHDPNTTQGTCCQKGATIS